MSGDVFGIEPAPPQVPGPPGPPGPAATNVLSSTATGVVLQGSPLYPSSPDHLSVLTTAEAAVAALAGFAVAAASSGAAVDCYTDGVVPVFSGLTTGVEYFVYGPGAPVTFGSIPSGAWYRSVGAALNTTTLLFKRGPVFQKP